MLFRHGGAYRRAGPYRWTSRYSRPSRLRFVPLILLFLAIYDLCSILTPPPVHRAKIPTSLEHESSSLEISKSKLETKPKEQRIFIASIHWNKEALLRSHWNDAVLNLVHHFGANNVYISILEGGSWDNTRAALSELDVELGRLGVERSIVFDDRTHEQEVERMPGPGEEGWVWSSRGKKELRRIPYLAGLRNRVMGVMRMLEGREGERKRFDKVLWLNDVVFTTEDVETLLQTRNGDYAAACSMDFEKPPLYYDTFALRDINGNEPLTQDWPYFNSYESRHALFSNKPVPVQSCWNGIVFFDAKPFYDDPTLNFRAIPDSLAANQLEGSECCLIHVDNKYSRKAGVWLNPNVRVGYNIAAYEAVNPANGSAIWPYSDGWDRVRAVWRHRQERTCRWVDGNLKKYMIRQKVRAWEQNKESVDGSMGEVGVDCLVNEMQVLTANGWAHV